MNKSGSQNYFGNYILSSFYRWGVPISDVLLLSSTFTLFALLCDTGAGPCEHFSFARWCSVRFHQKRALEGHRKATAEEGAFHCVWDALSPLKCTASGNWETQRCLLSREFSTTQQTAKDQLWSTHMLYQDSQPSGLLLQTSSSLYPLASSLATSSHFISKEDWNSVLGVGRSLLQALSAFILYSPSALEKVDLFTPSLVKHNEPFTS